MNVDTGITSEVLTIKSGIKLIDIFNYVVNKKSQVCFDYIEGLNVDANKKIVIIGTYFTGVGIAKRLSEKYSNILLVDIYPHLEDLLNTPIGGKSNDNIDFSSDFDLIYSGDIVIDTTGFGGVTIEQSSKLNVDAFIIEDPIAEDNDELLKNKNNIENRLDAVKSKNKSVLKTCGINTKTSGTMTLTIGVLTNVLNRCFEEEGILYSACEMGFYEEIVFKEKDISKFVKLSDKNALKISAIRKIDPDNLILKEMAKIESKMI